MTPQEEFIRSRAAFVRRGGATKRFHAVETICENTVAHHSFHVAWIVWMLTPNMTQARRLQLVMAALAHDLSEQVVGDIPAPGKRALGRQVVKEAEDSLLADFGLALHLQMADEDIAVLKFADCLDGAFQCVKERAMGNALVEEAYLNFRQYLLDTMLPGPIAKELVNYLDELWEKYDG